MSPQPNRRRPSFLALLSAFALLGSTPVLADPPASGNTETSVFSTHASMADNLKGLAGKRVTVYLHGGTHLTGTVKAMGDHLAHLEKLDGKDFYDALVAIDQIGAIDTRARAFGR